MNGDEKNILYYKGNTELKVDIEFLRNEMSQFLQLDNLNFLIGAGCSSHVVDGTEKGIPGMASLYDGFFEEHADFEIAGKIAKPLVNNSLEGMLEAMEAVSIKETATPSPGSHTRQVLSTSPISPAVVPSSTRA